MTMSAAQTFNFKATPRIDLSEIWVVEPGCEAASSIKYMKAWGQTD
jgi:hypothetical protein